MIYDKFLVIEFLLITRFYRFGMTGAKVKVSARVNKQVHSEVAVVVRELEKAEEQERSVKVGPGMVDAWFAVK